VGVPDRQRDHRSVTICIYARADGRRRRLVDSEEALTEKVSRRYCPGEVTR